MTPAAITKVVGAITSNAMHYLMRRIRGVPGTHDLIASASPELSRVSAERGGSRVRKHTRFIVGVVLIVAVRVVVAGNGAVGDGSFPDNAKPVSAAGLQGMLADPALSVERRVELLRGLGKRPLEPEAVRVALSGLRTCDPPVIYALSELLVNAGKRSDASAVLIDAALHPKPPYDRWVGAVGAVPHFASTRKIPLMRKSKAAVARGIKLIQKEDPKIQQEFLRALCSSKVGYYMVFLTPCRAMEQFLADALADEDKETASLALRVLGRDPSLYYFPVRGIPALARIAAGEDKKGAATASSLLKTIIGEEKPAALTCREWGERYAADKVLLEASLSRAHDQKTKRSARLFSIRQLLSLAIDAGPKEFVRCFNQMLKLAQDEKETISFRINVVVALLGEAFINVELTTLRNNIDLAALRRQLKDILFACLESPSADVKRFGVGRLMNLPGASKDREVIEKLTFILKDKGEPYLLRTTAALGLRYMGGSDDAELARTMLRILKESEKIPAEKKASMVLRAVLSEHTGLPSNSPIAAWEKALHK